MRSRFDGPSHFDEFGQGAREPRGLLRRVRALHDRADHRAAKGHRHHALYLQLAAPLPQHAHQCGVLRHRDQPVKRRQHSRHVALAPRRLARAVRTQPV
eukprot:1887120-Rhodomonas_salina.1